MVVYKSVGTENFTYKNIYINNISIDFLHKLKLFIFRKPEDIGVEIVLSQGITWIPSTNSSLRLFPLNEITTSQSAHVCRQEWPTFIWKRLNETISSRPTNSKRTHTLRETDCERLHTPPHPHKASPSKINRLKNKQTNR